MKREDISPKEKLDRIKEWAAHIDSELELESISYRELLNVNVIYDKVMEVTYGIK